MGHRHRPVRTFVAAALAALVLAAGACTDAGVSSEPTASGMSQGSTSTAPAPPETTPRDTTTTEPPRTTTQPAPTTTQPAPLPTATLAARAIWLFPGPDHFEGDVLSAQVPLGDFEHHELGAVTVEIDGEPLAEAAYLSSDPLLGGYLTITDAFDTAGAAGAHTIRVEATIDGEPLAVAAEFVVHSAADRPDQERSARWSTTETTCCLVHYLEGSAADRDLGEITAIIDTSAEAVASILATDIPTMEIVLLDVLWGNGGYAGGELVISYLDRDFGPATPETVAMTFVHELTHGAARTLPGDAPWPLDEALAVHVAGGHFKPEDVPARAAALAERGDLLPLGQFLDQFATMQHETRYAQAGALAAYLVETYGWDGFIDLYTAAGPDTSVSAWFDSAASGAVGVGIEEVDEGFRMWLSTIDASAESRDLDLSIALQEARRRYQATYAPYQNFFVYDSVLDVGATSVALREARAPELVAVEALISWTQRLVVAGRLDLAERAVAEIEDIVETGTIDSALASRVLAVALALDARGYELLSIDLDGESAAVTATDGHPSTFAFVAELSGGDVTLTGPMAEAS